MFILSNKGMTEIPRCKCGELMLPKDLQLKAEGWRCPACLREKKYEKPQKKK